MRSHLLWVLLVALLLPLSGCVADESSELEGDWYFVEDLVLDFERDGVIIGYVDDDEREGRWFVDDDGLLNVEWDDDSEAFAGVQFEVNGTWLFIYDSADDACGVLSRTSIDSSAWYDELEALTYPSFCPSEDEA